jgi:rubrerythrin
MGKDKKTLCKWDKDDIRDDLDKLKKIVASPKYICRKCGRVAKDEEFLCKPEKL